ncbi:hypothetical protein KW541_17750 [Vibrio fluvialis]|nr:hypothetical protein [Vibrio fluvialis]
MNNELEELIYRCLMNEISIDSEIEKKFKKKLSNRSKYKLLRFPKGFSKISSFVIVFFIPIIFVVFSLKVYLKRWINKSKDAKNYHALAFSLRQKDILNNYYKNIECIMIDELISMRSSFIDSYYKSVFISFKMLKRINVDSYIHIVHVWELVVFYYCLKEKFTHNNFLICSHYDRWATMVSLVKVNEFSVLQHGVVSFAFSPCFLLTPPSKLIALSNTQCDIFNKKIYTSPVKEVVLNTQSLDFDKSHKYDVVIINNPLYLDFEIKLYSALEKASIDVVFRPHPLVIEAINLKNLKLSKGKQVPLGKAFVCKESTLGLLYENEGISGVWWHEGEEVDKIVLNIQALLE